MKIQLSPEEKASLIALHRSLRERVEADRIKFVLLLNDGFTGAKAAEILRIDSDTATAWKARYTGRDESGDWYKNAYVPYFGKLSTYQFSFIVSFIAAFNLSSKDALIGFIKDTFSVCYSKAGLQRLLRRIGQSFRKPKTIPAGACPQKQAEAAAELYAFKENLPPGEEIIYSDFAHPQHGGVSSKSWMKKGCPKIMPSYVSKGRMNIAGSYSVCSGQILATQHPAANADAAIAHLGELRAQHPDSTKIHIVLDNAKYFRSKKVADYIAENPVFRLYFLPPYSPNLNLAERIWKLMREKAINRKVYASFADFEQGVCRFFREIGKYADEIKTRFTYKFEMFETISW